LRDDVIILKLLGSDNKAKQILLFYKIYLKRGGGTGVTRDFDWSGRRAQNEKIVTLFWRRFWVTKWRWLHY